MLIAISHQPNRLSARPPATDYPGSRITSQNAHCMKSQQKMLRRNECARPWSVQGQFAPSLQGVGYGESNTVTGRGSPGDPNGERVPRDKIATAIGCPKRGHGNRLGVVCLAGWPRSDRCPPARRSHGSRGHIPRPWGRVDRSQQGSPEPRPAQDNLGYHGVPDSSAGRPCRSMSGVSAHIDRVQLLPQPTLPELPGVCNFGAIVCLTGRERKQVKSVTPVRTASPDVR
jgi:hypothetical protein